MSRKSFPRTKVLRTLVYGVYSIAGVAGAHSQGLKIQPIDVPILTSGATVSLPLPLACTAPPTTPTTPLLPFLVSAQVPASQSSLSIGSGSLSTGNGSGVPLQAINAPNAVAAASVMAVLANPVFMPKPTNMQKARATNASSSPMISGVSVGPLMGRCNSYQIEGSGFGTPGSGSLLVAVVAGACVMNGSIEWSEDVRFCPSTDFLYVANAVNVTIMDWSDTLITIGVLDDLQPGYDRNYFYIPAFHEPAFVVTNNTSGKQGSFCWNLSPSGITDNNCTTGPYKRNE